MHPRRSHPDPTAREIYMALDFLCIAPIYFTVLNLYSNSHLIIHDEKKRKKSGIYKIR